jgi:hypothetical protein
MTPATSAVRRHSGIGPGTEPLDSKGAKVTLTAEAAESASGRFGELRAAAERQRLRARIRATADVYANAADDLGLCALANVRSSISGVRRLVVDLSCASRRFRALLVRVDFLFERILQVGRRLLELRDASSKRPAQFGQLARTEDYQRNHKNDDEFRHTEGTEHGVTPEMT